MNDALTKGFDNLPAGVSPDDLAPEDDYPRESGADRADRMED